MSGAQRLGDLYLTASGRIGRRGFVFGLAPLAAIWTAFVILIPEPMAWVARVLALVLLYLAACVTAQRLHDRGRAGWWIWPLLTAGIAAWIWRETPFGWALGVLLVAPLSDLALRPGQPAFNRYGAPPH
ncbi:MAG: DUF805 domain-containing protein [Brevundimonas sp.]|uniref:DUF805 domain-containing protein n=1 Tax=Brevundimonas sp. TaxID=1871086 RepID=UPI0025BB6DD1|nr:DUF805 domain-containing protein [Brevundimonas sp.]MBX3476217.1 DUF805 domain-containing protein [Brevundimonas sp.]